MRLPRSLPQCWLATSRRTPPMTRGTSRVAVDLAAATSNPRRGDPHSATARLVELLGPLRSPGRRRPARSKPAEPLPDLGDHLVVRESAVCARQRCKARELDSRACVDDARLAQLESTTHPHDLAATCRPQVPKPVRLLTVE